MKKTNVLFHWVDTGKKLVMSSAFAVLALFLASAGSLSAQSGAMVPIEDQTERYPKAQYVSPTEAVQSLNDGIALIDDHIANNPRMTRADIEHGTLLKATIQSMINKIEAGTSVEEAFVGGMHGFQTQNRFRDRDAQRKLMRVRKEMHQELTL